MASISNVGTRLEGGDNEDNRLIPGTNMSYKQARELVNNTKPEDVLKTGLLASDIAFMKRCLEPLDRQGIDYFLSE